jgi:hypothetical protein
MSLKPHEKFKYMVLGEGIEDQVKSCSWLRSERRVNNEPVPEYYPDNEKEYFRSHRSFKDEIQKLI